LAALMGSVAAAALAALGDELLAGLWREIDALPPIGACAARRNLGMAHGWAGYLYASLRWCQAAGRPLPAALAGRLGALGDAAESWGRGLRWPWLGNPGHGEGAGGDAKAPPMAGWCNGSAGMVHLFTLAAAMLGDADAERLAVGAAWQAWEAEASLPSLCCGLAGRAYALLELHRWRGEEPWLRRAEALAERAARAAGTAVASRRRVATVAEAPDSLYRGRLGIALLAAELERPAGAAMPLFAAEGWPSG
jgi:eukaryotic-like serine/threonine-protein kinase